MEIKIFLLDDFSLVTTYKVDYSEFKEMIEDKEFLDWCSCQKKCDKGKKVVSFLLPLKDCPTMLYDHTSVRDWICYSYVLYNIKEFLPPDFKLLCCRCQYENIQKRYR